MSIRKSLAGLALLSLMSMCGCSIRREAQDFQSSYGVLYPVKKTGQAVEWTGAKLSDIASPREWTTRRPEALPASPTEEQERVLQEHCIEFDLTKPYELQMGFGAASHQFAPPLRSFLLQVEHIAGTRFDWRLNPNLNDGAMAFPGGVIIVNPRVASMLSPNASMLLHLHEAAHHICGHATPAGALAGMSQPWLKPAMEMEADTWAARAMLRAGAHPQQIVYGAIELFDHRPATPTHPSGPQRIANIRQAVGF